MLDIEGSFLIVFTGYRTTDHKHNDNISKEVAITLVDTTITNLSKEHRRQNTGNYV
jgi:hypothetical protein